MYSANVWADPKLYASHFGADVRYDAFLESFARRAAGGKVVFPPELDQAFLDTQEPELEVARDLVIAHRLAQVRAADEEITSQSARLADATHRLATAPTKAAEHSLRMSAQKVSAARRRRASLVQGVDQTQVGRVFPGTYVPVLVMQEGKLTVRPMRYQCRPSHVERRMENLLDSPHHARRDGLSGRWHREFGHTHGLIAAETFFDAGSLHRLRGRELAPGENLAALELEFVPTPPQTLYVPCLWAHWQRPGQPDLWSFAMIIDRAPNELVAIGQQWCPVTIRQEGLQAWLMPDANDLPALQALLDDRPPLHLEHFPSSPNRERLARPAPTKIINLWRPSKAVAKSNV
jgi:putative SOS response-associated peptidase YedK